MKDGFYQQQGENTETGYPDLNVVFATNQWWDIFPMY